MVIFDASSVGVGDKLIGDAIAVKVVGEGGPNTIILSLFIAPSPSLFTALNLTFKLLVSDTVTVIGLVIPAGAPIKVVPPLTEYI